MLLLKKNHISSLQNHQISIFVSQDPHYSLPEIFENKYCLTTNEKAKRQKKRNKTYLPSSSQNRNSHGECDANCRKHKGGHVEESLRPFSPKQNKPHDWFLFYFYFAATEESQILPFPSSTPQAPPPSPPLATHPTPLPPTTKGET